MSRIKEYYHEEICEMICEMSQMTKNEIDIYEEIYIIDPIEIENDENK
ncbi:hypothetical protein M0Q97_01500 [Candidatus Dojkabacteria bacterium]|jgi:hypothetical protein|nr:hypothetical protein [Candidatus Dojkabacteria bacterium]